MKAVELKKQLALLNKVYEATSLSYISVGTVVKMVTPRGCAALMAMGAITLNTSNTSMCEWSEKKPTLKLAGNMLDRINKYKTEVSFPTFQYDPKPTAKKKTEAKPLKPQPHTTGALTKSMNLLNKVYSTIRQGDGNISNLKMTQPERFAAKHMPLIEYKDGKWHWLREKPSREIAIQFTHEVNQRREIVKADLKARYQKTKAAKAMGITQDEYNKIPTVTKTSVCKNTITEEEFNRAKGLLENLTADNKVGFKSKAQVKAIVDKITQKMQGKIDIVEKCRAELSDIIVKDGRKFKKLQGEYDLLHTAHDDLNLAYNDLTDKNCDADKLDMQALRKQAIITDLKYSNEEMSQELAKLKEKYKGIVIKLPTKAIQLILTALGSAAVTGIIIYYILNVISIAS